MGIVAIPISKTEGTKGVLVFFNVEYICIFIFQKTSPLNQVSFIFIFQEALPLIKSILFLFYRKPCNFHQVIFIFQEALPLIKSKVPTYTTIFMWQIPQGWLYLVWWTFSCKTDIFLNDFLRIVFVYETYGVIMYA